MGRPLTEAGRQRRQISMRLDDSADLRREINNVLLAYGLLVDEEMQAAIDDVSKQAVKDLKAESKKHGWKNYAAGWTYENKPDKKGVRRCVLYNKKHGSLTHLLENGHAKVLWGRSTGKRVAGVKHIEPVNNWVAEELPKAIEKALQK